VLAEAGEFAGTDEDAGEHGVVEAPGIGVAQGGVVAAEQAEAVGERVFGRVGEAVVGAASDDTRSEEVREEAIPGDLAQADDDADFGQRGDFRGEVDAAVADLLGGGLIARGSAADDRGDPGMAQPKAVVARDGDRFGGESELVQDGVHEVAGAVAGEVAAGAVGAVRTGGEADDEHAGIGVAEAGDRTRPVGLVAVGGTAVLADAGAVLAQAGAEFARNDGLADAVLGGHSRGKLG